MPSSYTASLRYTLQATGENNNTWGVILNSGVFALVDTAIAGRLAFPLSGGKLLTTVNGATDEARSAFLDINGGTGGTITIPAVSKGYFVRNGAAGDVTLTTGSPGGETLMAGDVGPVFGDGAQVYGLRIGGETLRSFIVSRDQLIIDYVNLVVSSGSIALPPATGNTGKALIVRKIGSPLADAWVPDFVTSADVVGLADDLADMQTEIDAQLGLAIAFAVAL